MRRSTWSCLAFLFAVSTAPALAGSAQPTFQSFHDDYRATPKLEEFAAAPAAREARDLGAVAREFLLEHASSYGIEDGGKDLTLVKAQQSLLGTHFHFAQSVDAVPVERGSVIVSVDAKTNAVYRAYNNYYPGGRGLTGKSKKSLVTPDQALAAAWANLRVHGALQDQPKVDLVYRVDGKGRFRLVYLTYLDTQAPFGAWQHEIDATSGEVLSRVDMAIPRKAPGWKVAPEAYTGLVLDRRAATAAYERKVAAKASKGSNTVANGKGLVFDPDPRTTLNDAMLEDASPAPSFDAAYFERDLLGLAFDGRVYKLEGPWVTIKDFESPATMPSTTTDGRWTAKRGDNAFADAMTYFHLDQNQRYMQSLGFTGDKGIQAVSIEADSDGVNGDDNSHFIPSSNRLAFGHGCVDDNEDADVILHEYGHAINFSINNDWEGGDTGAMGEGFGDYWAASYSVSSAAGRVFQPNFVFSWDGHGTANSCWPGRVLDATTMMYDHGRIYGAHQTIGQHASDELWSTPLFQTLTALMARGIPRSEVDQIILEAQFGLGANLKMRDLAQATIATARRLQPGRPHADVFLQKFAAQQIVLVPQAILALGDVEYGGLGNGGVADPGEAPTLQFTLANRGTLPATEVSAVLTSETDGVAVVNGQITFSDTDAGATIEANETPVVQIGDAVACGTLVKLKLTVTYTGGLTREVAFPVEFRLGAPEGMQVSATPNLPIPDDMDAGISDMLAVDVAANVSANLQVDVAIQHPYVGDLTVALTSPRGTVVKLHAESGGSQNDLRGRYPTTLTPAEPLSRFMGEPMAGDWKLSVVDSAAQDEGSLLSWGLSDVVGYECR